MNKAVFLDRDGIIIEDTGFPGAVGKVVVIPDAINAVKTLRELGFIIIVITNQSAVARGFMDEKGVRKINQEISRRFHTDGAKIDKFYFCPHLPEGTVKEYAIECECRKPKSGMVLKAIQDFNIDIKASFFIGDSESDLQAAIEAGVDPIFIGSINPLAPSFATLSGAISYIIENSGLSKN